MLIDSRKKREFDKLIFNYFSIFNPGMYLSAMLMSFYGRIVYPHFGTSAFKLTSMVKPVEMFFASDKFWLRSFNKQILICNKKELFGLYPVFEHFSKNFIIFEFFFLFFHSYHTFIEVVSLFQHRTLSRKTESNFQLQIIKYSFPAFNNSPSMSFHSIWVCSCGLIDLSVGKKGKNFLYFIYETNFLPG